ncbi:MAG: aminopeptidase [Bacteroidetes bacterium HGW-Bacteroidetes-16]|jgi:predicted enzyme related to lactoylglutathione lyase|nr:MAG: aminopeptidase [Bacteroidetes bacterium HGW-Bacteroidetes-16]
MKKIYTFSLLILLSIGFQTAFAQPLKMRLDQLKSTYDFSFKPLETNTDFSEKYMVYFNQPVDYHGGCLDSFNQRVFISHRNFDQPVVFITEGYGANSATEKDFEYELTKYLDANQVCIEHRYFSESRPDSLAWKFLSVENAATDHHRIAGFVKEIYPGKLIATGISKGGQTVNYFKYFYPEDADICVPYVAPVAFSSEDKRVYPFLAEVGDSACRNAVLNYQLTMLKDKKKYLDEFINLANKKHLTYSMGFEKAYDLLVFEYSFAFWQWGTIDCDKIPTSSQNAARMVNHLDKVAGIDWISNQGIEKLQPYFYQAMHEIGLYGYDIKPFKEYTSYQSNPTFDFTFPKGEQVVFEPDLMYKVDFYLRHLAKNMIFIYGENDPWSATAVDLDGQTNSIKIVKKGGSHRTRINNLPEGQQKQVLDSIHAWLSQENHKSKIEMENRKKVTGIGGVFFKSKDPKMLNDWYNNNLGLVTNEYGSLFEFRSSDNPDQKGYLQWSPFAEKTTYFEPSEKEFMINYRVENLEDLVKELKENGVTVLDEIETYEYGKFVHIMDPEGNKIELWEPVDNVFTKMYNGKTTK